VFIHHRDRKRAAHPRKHPPLRLAHRDFRACVATHTVHISDSCDKRNMAPNRQKETSVDPQEREEFLDALEKYHEQRG
jgi:hypothetical protein